MKDENIIIVGRFFEIVETLKREKIIRGLKTLCDRYGWNRWNVQTMREDPAGHSSTPPVTPLRRYILSEVSAK